MATSINFEVVREMALALPGVTESTLHRTPALKLRGRIFTCPAINRSAEPDTLVVRIDAEQRAQLIAADPVVYYLTDHYADHPMVLVRLSKIDRKSLRDLLQVAYDFASSEPRAVKKKSSRAGTKRRSKA